MHHAYLAERITVTHPQAMQLLESSAAGAPNPGQAAAIINRLIDQQSFMLAANDVMFSCAILFLALVAIVWLARPERVSTAADTGGAH